MKSAAAAQRPFVELAAVAAAAVAITFACYAPSLRAAFVSDDINAIVENEWVTGPFDPVGITTNFSWWGSSRADSPGFRPAATASFAWNRMASGLDVSAFRACNFLLHAGCVVLLFGLARALDLGRPAAAAAAAAFAVLPIHSEAVIWIVGRAELGAAAGFLAAAWLLVVHRKRGSAAALAGAIAAMVLGLLFKENAITVLAWPAALGLALRGNPAPGPVATRRAAVATAGLLGGGLVYALLRLAAGGGVAHATGPVSLLDNPLAVVDPVTRLLGAIAVLGRYLALTVWPHPLSVDYSFDALGIGPGFRANGDTALVLLFAAATVAALRWGRGRKDIAAAGLLLAASSYSIVSNTVFVLGTILGERLFYLPSAGLCLAAAAMAEPWLTTTTARRGAATTRPRVFAAAVAVGLGGAAILVNIHRAREWTTPVALFESAVRAVPRSARAHMELASAYGSSGRLAEALPHFAEALRVHPEFAAAAYNRGNLLAQARRYDDAVASYRQAVRANPRLLRAWDNLAVTERIRGNTAGWIDALRGASEAFPEAPTLTAQLGEALILTGRAEEAIVLFDRLIAGGDRSATTYFNRGVAGHHLGGCASAIENYRKAAAAPDAPREVFTATASCLRELGQAQEAAEIDRAGQVANRGTRR